MSIVWKTVRLLHNSSQLRYFVCTLHVPKKKITFIKLVLKPNWLYKIKYNQRTNVLSNHLLVSHILIFILTIIHDIYSFSEICPYQLLSQRSWIMTQWSVSMFLFACFRVGLFFTLKLSKRTGKTSTRMNGLNAPNVRHSVFCS